MFATATTTTSAPPSRRSVIDKLTLASIYIPTLLIFNLIDANLFFIALFILNWYGTQEFCQMRTNILFFNKNAPMKEFSSYSAIPRNSEWQMYVRSLFSASYMLLAMGLWGTGHLKSSYYTLLSYTFLSFCLLGKNIQ